MKYTFTTTCLALAAGIVAHSSNAAVIETNVFTEGSTTTYDANAVSNDLINQGAVTLGSFTSSLPGTWPAAGTNDGSATGGTATGDYAYWDLQTTITLTYELTGSATGYDIESINSIYGWESGNRHAAQYYTVFVATLDDPSYQPLHTVAYDPVTERLIAATSQVTLTDSTGTLASGVTGIRLVVIDDALGNNEEVGVIHEIDVIGQATAPEPSSMALLAAAGLLILRRRRG